MDKKIVIPKGMIKAFTDALLPFDDGCDGWSQVECESALEAALLWLSEHPIVPTDEQANEMWDCSLTVGKLCAEWQRRMFLAPEMSSFEKLLDQMEADAPKGAYLITVQDGKGNELARREIGKESK